MRPARIVGILRFVFRVRRRCGVDVSAMDTNAPPDLLPRPTIHPKTTNPPELAPQKPRHSHVSEVRRQHNTLNPRTRGPRYDRDIGDRREPQDFTAFSPVTSTVDLIYFHYIDIKTFIHRRPMADTRGDTAEHVSINFGGASSAGPPTPRRGLTDINTLLIKNVNKILQNLGFEKLSEKEKGVAVIAGRSSLLNPNEHLSPMGILVISLLTITLTIKSIDDNIAFHVKVFDASEDRQLIVFFLAMAALTVVATPVCAWRRAVWIAVSAVEKRRANNPVDQIQDKTKGV